MISINPYLNFNGKTEEAFNFYKTIFRTEFALISRYSDMPAGIGNATESQKKLIMHVSLPIGNTVLMGSDAPESMKVMQGNNFHVSVNLDDKQEAKRIFDALSENGKVSMPIADSFWGAYFGMLTDKFGVHWMVNCENKK